MSRYSEYLWSEFKSGLFPKASQLPLLSERLPEIFVQAKYHRSELGNQQPGILGLPVAMSRIKDDFAIPMHDTNSSGSILSAPETARSAVTFSTNRIVSIFLLSIGVVLLVSVSHIISPLKGYQIPGNPSLRPVTPSFPLASSQKVSAAGHDSRNISLRLLRSNDSSIKESIPAGHVSEVLLKASIADQEIVRTGIDDFS